MLAMSLLHRGLAVVKQGALLLIKCLSHLQAFQSKSKKKTSSNYKTSEAN